MDWIDYRKKLGIDFEDEEKGAFCTSLILNYLCDLFERRQEKQKDIVSVFDFEAVSNDEYKIFCLTTGKEYGDSWSVSKTKIYDELVENKSSFKKFLVYYVAFINCLSNREDGIKQEELLDLLDKAFTESKLSYAILKDSNEYFIFPKGAKELDDALVSEPLAWLSNYPQTKKAWMEALTAYSNLSDDNASEAADKFRKALERFFQEFFNKTQSLENMKAEYGRYLKSKGVPPEISNNLETLYQCYTNYMNNYAKHHDKTSKNVLEYIMYQTGNIIRLLITLKGNDTDFIK